MLVQVGRRFVSEQRELEFGYPQAMRKILSNSKVFKNCHEEFVRDLIVTTSRKVYGKSRFIMEEGEAGDSMIVILKGCAEVTSRGKYVCTLRDEAVVGEAALLDVDNRRTATVKAEEPCDVAIIYRNAFHSVLEGYEWDRRRFQKEMKANLAALGKLMEFNEDINVVQQAGLSAALMRVPFFARDESLHGFACELAMHAQEAWFPADRVIMCEGDANCNEMYVLVQGTAEVSSCGIFLGRIENDILGEVCVLDLLKRRTATVKAVTMTHCIVLPRRVLNPILAKYPNARMQLLEMAKARLAALSEAHSASGAAASARARDCAEGLGGDPSAPHVFAAFPFFSRASSSLRSELTQKMREQKVHEGTIISGPGASIPHASDCVFWLWKGQVEVWYSAPPASDVFVGVYGEGEVFGDLDAFGPCAHQVMVKAKTRCTIGFVAQHLVRDIVENHRFGDAEVLERWAEQRAQRITQLEHISHAVTRQEKTIRIDVMFMKTGEVGCQAYRGQKGAMRLALAPAADLADLAVLGGAQESGSMRSEDLQKTIGGMSLPGMVPG